MDGSGYIYKVQEALHSMDVGVITVAPGSPVVDVVAKMVKLHSGIAVICSQDLQVKGIVSERDILRLVADNPKGISHFLIDQISTDHPVTCSPHDDIHHVIDLMLKGGYRHMPVVEYGVLKGGVSLTKLLTYLLSEAEAERKAFALSHMDYL